MKEIGTNMVGNSSPIFKAWFLPVAIVSVVILQTLEYGFVVHPFLVYNAHKFIQFSNPSNYFRDPLISLMNDNAVALGLFYKYFDYILMTPIPFIVASIVIRGVVIYLTYKVVAEFIEDREVALITAFFYVVSKSALSGVGMNDAPFFYWGSVSMVFSLLGMLYAIRGNLTVASIMFCLSLHFHLFNGFAVLVFFIPGLFLMRLRGAGKRSGKLDAAVAMILLTATLFYFNFKSYGLPLHDAGLFSVQEWMHFLLLKVPDDTFMWSICKLWGWLFGPLLMYALWISYRNGVKRDSADFLTFYLLGAVATVLVVLSVELMHQLGIFMPKLSAIFIGLELNRGVWVIFFFSTIVMVKHLYSGESRFDSKFDAFLFALMAAMFLGPKTLTMLLVIAFCVAAKRNTLSVWIAAVFFSALAISFGGFKSLAELSSMKYAAMELFIAGICVFVLSQRNKKHLHLMILSLFLMATTAVGLKEQHIQTSFRQLAADGLFSPIQTHQLFYRSKAVALEDVALWEALRAGNTEHDYVLLPPSVEIPQSDLPASATLLLETYPYFSLPFFNEYMYRYALMLGDSDPQKTYDSIFGGADSSWHAKLEERYLAITEEHLGMLKKEYHVGYIVTPREYTGLQLIKKGTRSYLYKL